MAENLLFVNKAWVFVIPWFYNNVYVLNFILPIVGLPAWKVESGTVVPVNTRQLTPVAPYVIALSVKYWT